MPALKINLVLVRSSSEHALLQSYATLIHTHCAVPQAAVCRVACAEVEHYSMAILQGMLVMFGPRLAQEGEGGHTGASGFFVGDWFGSFCAVTLGVGAGAALAGGTMPSSASCRCCGRDTESFPAASASWYARCGSIAAIGSAPAVRVATPQSDRMPMLGADYRGYQPRITSGSAPAYIRVSIGLFGRGSRTVLGRGRCR